MPNDVDADPPARRRAAALLFRCALSPGCRAETALRQHGIMRRKVAEFTVQAAQGRLSRLGILCSAGSLVLAQRQRRSL
jgi:hypothetical protein